jgi:hypothetical protein
MEANVGGVDRIGRIVVELALIDWTALGTVDALVGIDRHRVARHRYPPLVPGLSAVRLQDLPTAPT